MLGNITLSDFKYYLQVVPAGTGNGPYELLLVSRSEPKSNTTLLEIFDTLMQANTAAHHFAWCYSVALSKGFRFSREWFRHPKGYEVHIAEVFALKDDGKLIDVRTFRDLLVQAKKYRPVW